MLSNSPTESFRKLFLGTCQAFTGTLRLNGTTFRPTNLVQKVPPALVRFTSNLNLIAKSTWDLKFEGNHESPFTQTCEGGERKPARVFSVKPARKMISNIDYPIISHLSNMPTFFWAKTRQIRGADTPRGRNVPGKEAGQRQTKWHTVWCAISICHTWPRR